MEWQFCNPGKVDSRPMSVSRSCRRVSQLALVWLLISPASAGNSPLIAIILDDLGNNLAAGRGALNLPGQVTYSFLPRTPHASFLASQAVAKGRETMLHLPMQSVAREQLGPGGLTQDMPSGQLQRTILEDIRSIPSAAGVNNHMGSLLTRDAVVMGQLMAILKDHPGMYFLDSRTDRQTVAEQVAREMGVPTGRRNVFLDNERNEDYILRQFNALLGMARKSGAAVGIGHPYPETLRVLEKKLAELESCDVVLVPVSELIEHQRRNQPWPVSSSPLHTAARSLKP